MPCVNWAVDGTTFACDCHSLFAYTMFIARIIYLIKAVLRPVYTAKSHATCLQHDLFHLNQTYNVVATVEKCRILNHLLQGTSTVVEN